jgi:hypothetical protein
MSFERNESTGITGSPSYNQVDHIIIYLRLFPLGDLVIPSHLSSSRTSLTPQRGARGVRVHPLPGNGWDRRSDAKRVTALHVILRGSRSRN